MPGIPEINCKNNRNIAQKDHLPCHRLFLNNNMEVRQDRCCYHDGKRTGARGRLLFLTVRLTEN